MMAAEAWEPHFSSSGVPAEWLRGQEEELRSNLDRLEDEDQVRSVVHALGARWRFERDRGSAP